MFLEMLHSLSSPPSSGYSSGICRLGTGYYINYRSLIVRSLDVVVSYINLCDSVVNCCIVERVAR